ncbi:HEAT repeat domain-containing protein [Microbispora sp. ATCC PTA-5024]|uniref:HEAT repeat domain-containing protein n=1 Tax=Microbispora sp. ATCC PTA-5024 TaxID=316330 RepID=UPI0003F5935E|nr:HEAT repeat domain-containing protein [Microbispora sp. ATCC PTA-5024]
MIPLLPVAEMDDEHLVDALASAPRRSTAHRELLRRGRSAVPAIQAGLGHAEEDVREQCCRLLDQLLVEEALDGLVAMLDDPSPKVRVAALHALACERCKQDACRPSEAAVLPPATRLLRGDPDAHVRAMAVELVASFAHSRQEAVEALIEAREHDPSPTVRKKAGWYAPGGVIHRRTAPRAGRATPRRAARSGTPGD